MTDYTESVSGFKIEGNWGEVVAHGEKIAYALMESEEVKSDFESEFEDYNEWRPKVEENIEHDISEKTAEKASIDESEVEKENDSPTQEMKEAGKEISKGTKDIDAPEKAAKNIGNSFVFFARALSIFARQSMRHSEEAVYRRLMTVLSPYYFDNELVSANITKQGENQYKLEININDDDLKNKVSDKMLEYKDAESWRVDSPVETSNIKEAEGVEVPDMDDEIVLEE